MRLRACLMLLVLMIVGLLLPSVAVASNSHWTVQVNLMKEASFVDSNNGWAVGYDGKILHTSDGGSTWEVQTSGTEAALGGVSFIDTSHGWAVGGQGTILATDDGGDSWSPQTSGTSSGLEEVTFVDSDTGWAVGSNGTILKTQNGGESWVSQNSGTTMALNSVDFTDAANGWACGVSGTLLHTTNGGATWVPQSGAGSANLRAITFVDSDTGWAVAGWTALHTIDGGATWTSQTIGMSAFDACFVDANNGWAVGPTGAISRTQDGGATWASQSSGTVRGLSGVSFSDATHGIAVGENGTILRTSNGGSMWTIAMEVTGQPIYGISFADSENGWAVAKTGAIMHTSDGGDRWFKQQTWATNDLFAVSAVDATHAWAVGADDAIVRTTNGGATWTGQFSNASVAHRAVEMVDLNNGWAVGDSGTIVHTANGGSSMWLLQTSPTTRTLRGVSFVDANNGWAVGDYGTIIHTTNGGSTWTTQTAGTTANLNAVDFVDANNGWAVGQQDKIFHTSNGGATWTLQPVAPGSQFGATLRGVSFADVNTGWAVGDWGDSFYTHDGGTTWTFMSNGTGSTGVLNACSAGDANNCWAAGTVATLGSIRHAGDTDPPSSTITSPVDGAVVRGATCTISGTATDDQSGIAYVQVSPDGGLTWQTATGTASWTFEWTLPADGVYTIKTRAVDVAGNPEIPGPGHSVTVDNTAPVTELTTDPEFPDGLGGWFLSSPTVTLGIGEPGSTYYQWDSDSGEGWLPYIGAISAPEGAHTLYYYSVDLVGNIEFVQSREIKTDGAAPTVEPILIGDLQENAWYVSDVELSIEATDAAPGSGVAVTQYSFDGTNWSAYASPVTVSDEGTTTVLCRSVDAAGNASETEEVTFSADKTPPTTDSDVSGTLGDNGWYVSDVQLALAAADQGGSGLSGTSIGLGDGAYAGPVTLSAEGTSTVAFRSEDRAGNVEGVQVRTVRIDKRAPITKVRLRGHADASGMYRSPVTVSLSAHDAPGGSGVGSTEFSLDGVSWTAYSQPIQVSESGPTTVRYRSVDEAGNVGATAERTFTIAQ